MDLQKKYFYAILPYVNVSNYELDRPKQLNEILYKFECILKSGYILPYNEISQKFDNISRHPLARINGDDSVSISCHKKIWNKLIVNT